MLHTTFTRQAAADARHLPRAAARVAAAAYAYYGYWFSHWRA